MKNNRLIKTDNKLLSNLSIAQLNTSAFVVILYLQDVFWLIVSRIKISSYDSTYIISNWDWLIFLLFISLSFLFAIFGFIAGRIARPISRIYISYRTIINAILLTIILNIYSFITIDANARYVSGGLTGVAGIVYGLKNAANLACFIILVKFREKNKNFPSTLVYVLMLSGAINIDGFASALSLGMFAWLMFDVNFRSKRQIFLFAALVAGLFYLGFTTKFSQVPDYLTPEFLISWIIGRFSIQAEQMYTFLAGDSIINNQISYFDLMNRMISNRIDLIFGHSLNIEYPRSVSEAIFYDMMGFYDAGSSPGALLGTTLQGPFSFIVPFILAFIFIQFFYGIRARVSILNICAYSFAFKMLHSNFSEYLTIISPTLLTVIVFLLASLCEFRDKRTTFKK